MAPVPHVQPNALGEREPLRACFGIGCARHHRCAHYEAVARSEASRETLGTCTSGGLYPLFIEIFAGDASA